MPSAGNAGYGFGMAGSGESLRLGHIGRTEGLEFDTMPRGKLFRTGDATPLPIPAANGGFRLFRI